jgi:predicted DNA-binding transcriptional regulator YafY
VNFTDPKTMTSFLHRAHALLAALRDGPLARPDVLQRVMGVAYPEWSSDSTRKMIDRDIERLQHLGIIITRSATRPPIYTLIGGTPHFTADDIRALSLVRTTFGDYHPQAAQVQSLLDRLTAHLDAVQQHAYHQSQALSVPVQPVIDYTPYASLIHQLEQAITAHQMVRFRYRSSRGELRLHRRVEPHAIEYYERHFYLVAYSHNSKQVHDFRIDRIQEDEAFRLLARLPPEMAHARRLITFRYRLDASLAQGDISQRFVNQRIVERLPNGDIIIEAQGRSDFFIRRMLLKYAGGAELLSPDWLRAQMAREVAALYELYQTSHQETPDDTSSP